MNYETVCNLHAYFMLLRKYTHIHTQKTHTLTHTYSTHTHTYSYRQMAFSALSIFLCISIINLAGNWPSADRQAAWQGQGAEGERVDTV